jgi:hypothetical protein
LEICQNNDIGGGDDKLVDYLLDEGYENITVLDISAKALERAKIQLGKEQIKYIGLFRTSMISNLYHL